jgi:hypothetical protein
MKLLSQAREEMKDPKYEGLPDIGRIYNDLEKVLPKVKAAEAGETDWETYPASRIVGRSYETARSIADIFGLDGVFTVRDFYNKTPGMPSTAKRYEKEKIRLRLERLNRNGFLEKRTAMTGSIKNQYRMTKAGLDMLQKQAMKKNGMRIV